LLLSLILAFPPVFAGEPAPQVPTIGAQAAILMDRQSGVVLWSRNPDQPLPMASTTKIMTAMVILDHGRNRLHEQVTVSKHAFQVAQGGSSQFAAGDSVKLDDLLTAALVISSNEATVAAAEFLAGDEQTFVGWMNEKAKALGLQHTHFTNPHGFTRPQYYATNHYSSARDLAIMARCALTDYPEIRERIILAAKGDIKVYASPRGYINLHNHNALLGKEVPGIPGSCVDGVKTGYIKDSGYCYVGSATANGWQLIAVFLNDKDRFTDALTLFQYGFSHYDWKTYASDTLPGLEVSVARGAVRKIPLGAKWMLGAPVPKTGAVRDEVRFVGKRLKAPIDKGETVGTLSLFRDGREIASAHALALQSVKVAWWVRAGVALLYTLLVLALLALVGVAYGTRAKNARRRRRELKAGRRRTD